MGLKVIVNKPGDVSVYIPEKDECKKLGIILIRSIYGDVGTSIGEQEFKESDRGTNIRLINKLCDVDGIYEVSLLDENNMVLTSEKKYLGRRIGSIDITVKNHNVMYNRVILKSNIVLNQELKDLYVTDGFVNINLPRMRKIKDGYIMDFLIRNERKYKVILDSCWDGCFDKLEYTIY